MVLKIREKCSKNVGSLGRLSICSARLFPLKKKNGKVRPVAVGDTFRRVIEKVALALPASKELLASLLPIQTGLSGNAICEQVALSLQEILSSNPANPPG